MTTPLLFLSGAGLPGWIWDDVRAGAGVPSVVAPRPAAGRGTVTDHARAALDAAPDGPFTLVAHSAGGVVAAELARIAPPGRIAAVLAIAAVIPAPGESFVSSLPFPQRLVLPLVLRVAGTRPPEAAVRKGLAADLDEATTSRLLTDFVPESREYFTTRAASTGALLTAPSRGEQAIDIDERHRILATAGPDTRAVGIEVFFGAEEGLTQSGVVRLALPQDGKIFCTWGTTVSAESLVEQIGILSPPKLRQLDVALALAGHG